MPGRSVAAAAIASALSLHASPLTSAHLQDTQSPVEKSSRDKAFDSLTLHQDTNHPGIQKIAIIGRYHGQYYYLDSSRGNAKDWEHRRARIGLSLDFLQSLSFEFNTNLNFDTNAARFSHSLEDATLKWTISDHFEVSLGKQKAPITHEWSTSSNKILTIERSLIVNSVAPDKMGGLLATCHADQALTLMAGIYSNSVDKDWEYPTFDASLSLFGSIAYKFGNAATLRLDYLYQDPDREANQSTPYEHAFSLNYSAEYGKLAIVLDAIYGIGAGDTPDVYGLVAMPSYDITSWLQAVVRYTYANSESNDGLSLQTRYEREAPDLITNKGNNYHSLYTGLNWYVRGDNFKLMTGVELAIMDQAHPTDDYKSITYFAAFRIFF